VYIAAYEMLYCCENLTSNVEPPKAVSGKYIYKIMNLPRFRRINSMCVVCFKYFSFTNFRVYSFSRMWASKIFPVYLNSRKYLLVKIVR